MTGPSPSQHRRMRALLDLAGVHDRPERLALTGAIVGRAIGSLNELTAIEALDVIDYLTRLNEAGELVDRSRWWLDNFHRKDVA